MWYGRLIEHLRRALMRVQGPRLAPVTLRPRSVFPPLVRRRETARAQPAPPPVATAAPDAVDQTGTAAVAPAHLRRLAFEMFSPAQPVESRSQLLGRTVELRQLSGALLTMRAHAIVFGARGAGKTSLVRAFGDRADELGNLVLYMSCGGDSGFAEVFGPYLADLPPECFAAEDRKEALAMIAALPAEFGARALAAILQRISRQDVILVVDEFDRVQNLATRREIAALLKLLSDLRARVQILFVGIARDLGELIDAHPSLRRHLVAVPLRRFDVDSATDLFVRGERGTGLRFTPAARAEIMRVAVGSPYHLRLFCFTAAMAAIDRDGTTVDIAETLAGLEFALDMWSATNPSVAALFAELAHRGPAVRRQLETIAREALADERLVPPVVAPGPRGDGVDPRAGVFAALQPALVAAGEDGAFAFEDTLAPQLLLVTCRLAADRAPITIGQAAGGHAA